MKQTESFGLKNNIFSSVTRVTGALFEPRTIPQKGGTMFVPIEGGYDIALDLSGEACSWYGSSDIPLNTSELWLLSQGQNLSLAPGSRVKWANTLISTPPSDSQLRSLLGWQFDKEEFLKSFHLRFQEREIAMGNLVNEIRHRATSYGIGLTQYEANALIRENFDL